MAPPDSAFQDQTRSMKASRPRAAPVGALPGQLALDHHLRRDPGVVHAGLPERVAAGLAAVAREHVLQRVVEGVAHVQAAGDVRRRHHHAPGLSPAGAPGEAAARLPKLVKAALEIGRPIGLLQHRRLVTVSGRWG